jgi:tRNA pseudouridine38-40 synthase
MLKPATFALALSYNGEPFSGFARQKDPEIPTVQGELERALATVLRTETPVVCAGRTDAGVHALRQVVSFAIRAEVAAELDTTRFLRSLNALTPDAISVIELRRARPGFSARFDATEREYRYRICNRQAPPVFLSRYTCHIPQTLDKAAMEEASRALIGEHDFKSFCVAASAEGKSTVREVTAIDMLMHEPFGEPMFSLCIKGNAFLHSMVRTMVGTLLEVGMGAQPSTYPGEALAARNRAAAGPTAPAKGLSLHKVSYPKESWL